MQEILYIPSESLQRLEKHGIQADAARLAFRIAGSTACKHDHTATAQAPITVVRDQGRKMHDDDLSAGTSCVSRASTYYMVRIAHLVPALTL